MVELVLHLLKSLINNTSHFILAWTIVFINRLAGSRLLKPSTNFPAHAKNFASKLANKSLYLGSEATSLSNAVFDRADDVDEIVVEEASTSAGRRLRVTSRIVPHKMLDSL
jgi:hypothetical protein